MAEKGNYVADATPEYGYEEPQRERIASIANDKGARMGEAVEAYGDVQVAEAYGYVARG